MTIVEVNWCCDRHCDNPLQLVTGVGLSSVDHTYPCQEGRVAEFQRIKHENRLVIEMIVPGQVIVWKTCCKC